MYFLHKKTVVWSLSIFRLAVGRRIEGKSFVVPFYTSSFCLWEVSVAFIHRRIRSTLIKNSFSLVVRLLKSQLWSKIVNISGMSINFTFWKSRRSWYYLIKYPAFASVKTVTPPPKSFVHYNCVFLPCFWCTILCWTVLSTSSIRHQHPLRTLMH